MKSALWLVLSLAVLSASGQVQHARISGTISYLPDNDTITLVVSKYFGSGYGFGYEFEQAYRAKVVNHSFVIDLPVTGPYMYMQRLGCQTPPQTIDGKTKFFILGEQLLESGDDIHITDTNTWFAFSGSGSAKWEVQHSIDTIKGPSSQGPHAKVKAKLDYLQQQQKNISGQVYQLLKSDVLNYANYGYEVFGDSLSNPDFTRALNKVPMYDNSVWQHYVTKEYLQKKEMAHPGWFAFNLIARYKVDSCYLLNKPFSVGACYRYLKSNYTGELRDYLVSLLMYLNRFNGDVDPTEMRKSINDALSYVRNKDYAYVLNKVRDSNLAGSAAYNFSLPDTDGKTRRLADFRGKVVMVDFWYTGCGTCKTVAGKLKEMEPQFDGKDIVFITVSIDKSREQWLKSVLSEAYSSPSKQAVNLYTRGKGADDPMIRNYGVTAYPRLILIDKSGKMLRTPVYPHIDNGKDLIGKINAALAL